jgi:hypothetical protein
MARKKRSHDLAVPPGNPISRMHEAAGKDDDLRVLAGWFLLQAILHSTEGKYKSSSEHHRHSRTERRRYIYGNR